MPVRGAGYVWANNSTTASYTPPGAYQYNSTSPFTAVNTVARASAGSYSVTFPNLGVRGGTAHVTAYGPTTHRCKVHQLTVIGTAARVWVACRTIAGAPVDTQFTASFTNLTTVDAGRKLGYVLANAPFAASYTPTTIHQANSSGATNTITRSGVGTYTVRMPGLGIAKGHVQVTAYSSGSEYCKVGSWGPSGTAQLISVKCFTTRGVPVDTMYTLTYVEHTNILGLGVCCNPDGNWSAYAWANNPSAASYVPATSYQFADYSDTLGTITRSAVGAYSVKWQGIDLNWGNVQVTAYGSGNATCKVANWNAAAGVQVRCHGVNGLPVDTTFDVAFTGPFVIG